MVHRPLERSSNRPEPLSEGVEMRNALDEIPISRNPAAILRNLVTDSQRREAAATAPPATTSDGKRPRSDSSSTTEPKRLKMIQGPKRPGPKNFQDIWIAQFHHRSFLQVGITQDFLIGSTTAKNLGYCVKLQLDGGVYGEPSVTVRIEINTTGIDLHKDNYDKSCTLTWEPRVKVNGKWMIDDIDWTWMTAPGLTDDIRDIVFTPEVRAENKGKFKQANIMALTLITNACKSSGWNPRWTDKLPVATAYKVKSTMAELLRPRDDGTRVMLTSVPRNTGAAAYGQHIFAYLKEAIVNRFPPFIQYMDEEMKPLLDYSLPTIDTIGDGMYMRQDKKTLATGQKVQDLTGRKRYRTMDLRYNWNTISSFAVMQGVPIFRDMQHARGLHVPLEKSWHHIFIQTLPTFPTDGKALQIETGMDQSFWVGVRMTRDPTTGMKDDIPAPGTTILLDINNADPKGERPHVRDPKNLWVGRVQTKDKTWHQTNGTDFCIFATKPRSVRTIVGNIFPRNRMVTNAMLPLAKFEVRTNLTPQKRNLRAFTMFCDEGFHAGLLDEMRLALWAEPNRADPPKFANLTLGPQGKTSEENQQKYMQLVDAVKATASLNASQEKVLRSPAKMRSNITCVAGPAGASKSKTITNEMISLTKVGPMIACVAGSNVAVNANGTAT